ncbi:AraC family transcriptional regulator [Chryseobacterium chendengshani]|uniref:helix-turn-helix domain-containing protein n=1 Tax=Chryseobacterium sp. LJ668 TaxID=2864040 RepID=UPI001C68A0E9|nr:AraC family transcriptional regulator [Chryseobacterium sp. LJ668]MBW8523495.1 AraC family transcriptional regulator [Chryseobacterium sp. LJ668]QYK15780.1 AraC family transcriptional regulator [Chryseobacterium sp. LJ668]
MSNKIETPDIVYSCHHDVSRKGENFVPKHTLSYDISGSFVLADDKENYKANSGDFNLIRKNQLVKFVKIPPENGVFESMNVYLSDENLTNFSKEYQLKAEHSITTKPLIPIKVNGVLQNFMTSLKMILESDLKNQSLIDLKIKELLLILLQSQPELKNILFDFSEPFKIDLEAFMNQNYRYNVNLDRFAYLTGRSLATFKRDFEKVFQTSPHKWILQKRLKEAHFLLKEGKSASDIFVDLGFEDLSHFSYVFKKQFGYSPTKIQVMR